ncbi:hypothetical protein YPPY48_0324, partial [Yersinia pestis PY-48]
MNKCTIIHYYRGYSPFSGS